jgi:hypothetical protein
VTWSTNADVEMHWYRHRGATKRTANDASLNIVIGKLKMARENFSLASTSEIVIINDFRSGKVLYNQKLASSKPKENCMSLLDLIFGSKEYRIPRLQGKLCRKCSAGYLQYNGCIRWNEGSKHELVEKMYKCDNCDHTFSNQFY